MSGPEDGARERVARVLAAHEPRYRSQHGEPDWFECGPDNDGPTTCTWRSDPEADSEVIAEAFRLHVADALLSVVADTTAGEADLAEGRRLVANVLSLPEAHRVEVGADLIARSLAARSGGAQDDGLREAQEKCATTGLDADVCFGDCCCPAAPPLLALLEPGDPDARMDAYYYGFERTGVGIIDAILSAVAQAGNSYHGTDMWAEEEEWTKPSHEQRIQDAANAAAALLRRALAGPDDARQDGGCEAVNPETGRRCVRPWPHDGMHQVADGRWFGDDARQDGAT